MNTQFESSIDWSRELGASLVWILQTCVVTAVCLLIVLVLVGRLTEWGRQYWRITSGYFTGRQSVPVWAVAGLLLLSTIISVRINVLLTYYVNDLFTAVQIAFQGGSNEAARSSGIDGFWASIAVFGVLAGVLPRAVAPRHVPDAAIHDAVANLVEPPLHRRLARRLRILPRPVHPPARSTTLTSGYSRTSTVFTAGVGGDTNNPIFNSSNTLLFGAVYAVVSVLSFGAILWRLSEPVTVGGMVLPKALFWIVIGYVLVVTVVAFVIGRPLIRLSYFNELRNAGFRYALVRLRDTGAAVGMYRGENAERKLLDGRLSEVMANYRNWLNRMMLFFGFNVTMSQAINPLPWIVQAQALFAQRISFGDVWQSSNAFTEIHNSLSFFRNAYDQFASYRAVIIRLDGLADQNSRTALVRMR